MLCRTNDTSVVNMVIANDMHHCSCQEKGAALDILRSRNCRLLRWQGTDAAMEDL